MSYNQNQNVLEVDAASGGSSPVASATDLGLQLPGVMTAAAGNAAGAANSAWFRSQICERNATSAGATAGAATTRGDALTTEERNQGEVRPSRPRERLPRSRFVQESVSRDVGRRREQRRSSSSDSQGPEQDIGNARIESHGVSVANFGTSSRGEIDSTDCQADVNSVSVFELSNESICLFDTMTTTHIGLQKNINRMQRTLTTIYTSAVRWQILLVLVCYSCQVFAHSNKLSSSSSVSAFEPDFVFPLENVTVAQGRDATFTCVVNNLGGHRVSGGGSSVGDSSQARVAWIKADAKAILAIHEHVITNNDRLSVTHNDFNTWTLVIRNVKMEDAGKYMCQVNTDPMKMQTAILEVVIPPDIVNEETSGDMMVPEGGSAKLVCRARGHPKPKITWRREDGREIIARNGVHQKTKALAVEGEMLTLSKVTRSEMGAYMCIASNGVPPSVSKRMKLQVHFHPLVQVPNQLVGAPVLTDVTLICNVEASPKAINYWQRENGEMIIAGDRYVLTEKEVNSYSIEMVLHIKRLQTSDFGGYKCISKNSIGDTEGTIRLYAMERPGRKSSDREEDMDDLINEVVLKENRHEDGARNQNGRLYKERGSDSGIYSGSDSLHGLAKHLNMLLYASVLLLINLISAKVQLRTKSSADYL